MTRLIQIRKGNVRRVALVEEPHLRPLGDCETTYGLAFAALESGRSLKELVRQRVTDEILDYEPIYQGQSEWHVLPPIDHPEEPARCLISGTGLTHLGSARGRDAMHAAPGKDKDKGNKDKDDKDKDNQPTDSMKMFQLGLERGRPEPGSVGAAPEWFYKGTGTILRAHGEALDIPGYAEDGGEEAEIAGIYLVDRAGQPRRLGLSVGNEFSDHRFERKNYLNLAASKLCCCALGPELVLDPEFQSVAGEVEIERAGAVLWQKPIRTGEAEMCHSLRNIEHHHFKFEAHRRPGDVHVHYFGADCLSFGDGIGLQNDDVIEIRFENFGRPLRNRVRAVASAPTLVRVAPFDGANP
jgi:hypothetical protein